MLPAVATHKGGGCHLLIAGRGDANGGRFFLGFATCILQYSLFHLKTEEHLEGSVQSRLIAKTLHLEDLENIWRGVGVL